jgi:hypothetical protein
MLKDNEFITIVVDCPDCKSPCNGKNCKCGWSRNPKKNAAPTMPCKYCSKFSVSAYNLCHAHHDAFLSIEHSKKYLGDLDWQLLSCSILSAKFRHIYTPDSWLRYQHAYRISTAKLLKTKVTKSGVGTYEIVLRGFIKLLPSLFSDKIWDKFR